ncbi:MAG: amidase, partial [Alphaproteobacteria bacterium]|nr:amidase [Alphaproteobacteria bacterium]
MDLAMMGATDLVAAYAARRLSPVEAVSACFARIRRTNPRVNAVCYLLEEEAMAAAKASEARWAKGRPLGRVDGVPTTIKDLANIKGHPTRKGSLTVDARPAAEDSPVTAFLRRDGAVFIAKTTTPEFGWAGVTHSPLTGITRNPWDETKTAGGSSG